ncbi:MAG: hypothetical protein DSZ06_03440 [Sulfurospirillum sp.]|nr:MAG: hypothetical protein DSZ06_03440 [Sulfurospirillum sp.]
MSRSFANWAAPSYVSGTILVVAYLIKKNKTKLVIISIVLHSLLGVTLYHYHDIAKISGIKLSRHTDPYKRVLGWKDVIDQIKVIRERYPSHFILSKSRGSVAELDYYLKEKTYIFNPNHQMENQYHMDRDLNKLKGKDFIFVGSDKDEMTLKTYFNSVKLIGKVVAPLYEDFNRSYTLFKADGFQGY